MRGVKENIFDLPMENPKVTVQCQLTGDMKFNLKNSIMMNFLSEVMDIVYTRTIREEEGGTYGVGTAARLSAFLKEYSILFRFDTNVEQRERLTNRAINELKQVIGNGAKADDFQKVKEAALKQYENSLRENRFWMTVMSYRALGNDIYTGRGDILKNITLEEFNKFLKKNIKLNNKILVVMNGTAK